MICTAPETFFEVACTTDADCPHNTRPCVASKCSKTHPSGTQPLRGKIEKLFVAVKTDQSCKTGVECKKKGAGESFRAAGAKCTAEHLAAFKDTPCANFEIPSCEKELAGFERSMVLYMKQAEDNTNFVPSSVTGTKKIDGSYTSEFSPIVTLSKCCKGKSVVQKGGGSGGEGGEPLPPL